MTPPTPTPRRDSEQPVLEYRPRAVNPAPKVGPSQWLLASLVLGGLSWTTAVLTCAGAASRFAWVPVSLAAAGLASGVIAAVHHLPRDTTASLFAAMFMSFSVLAIWLLALTLL